MKEKILEVLREHPNGLRIRDIAFAAVAEPEIVAADEAYGAQILQFCQKILPRG